VAIATFDRPSSAGGGAAMRALHEDSGLCGDADADLQRIIALPAIYQFLEGGGGSNVAPPWTS
jgi:hypothetical protein